MHSRHPNFLRRIDSNLRRVRDLETGVHPLTAEPVYEDSFEPQIVPQDGATGGVAGEAFWQKRNGTVSLFGYLALESGGGGIYGFLPERARPSQTMHFTAPIDGSPFYGGNPGAEFTRVRVSTNGELRAWPGPNEIQDARINLQGLLWVTE